MHNIIFKHPPVAIYDFFCFGFGRSDIKTRDIIKAYEKSSHSLVYVLFRTQTCSVEDGYSDVSVVFNSVYSLHSCDVLSYVTTGHMTHLLAQSNIETTS